MHDSVYGRATVFMDSQQLLWMHDRFVKAHTSHVEDVELPIGRAEWERHPATAAAMRGRHRERRFGVRVDQVDVPARPPPTRRRRRQVLQRSDRDRLKLHPAPPAVGVLVHVVAVVSAVGPLARSEVVLAVGRKRERPARPGEVSVPPEARARGGGAAAPIVDNVGGELRPGAQTAGAADDLPMVGGLAA
eukprot:SAG11_NODE_213_length_12262_cov_8.391597_16_plen_190_part_00